MNRHFSWHIFLFQKCLGNNLLSLDILGESFKTASIDILWECQSGPESAVKGVIDHGKTEKTGDLARKFGLADFAESKERADARLFDHAAFEKCQPGLPSD